MAKKVHQLVDTEIKKAKAKDKPYTLTDGGGLFLLVSITGSKSWRFNYYQPITKKRTKIALGMYPTVNLSKARALRDEYKKLLADDIDPQQYIKNKQQEKLQETQNTFLAIAEQWKQKKSAEIKPATLKNHWRRLELYAFPTLGNISITMIKPLQVTELVTPLFLRGVNSTGVLLLQTINEIMRFAVNRGIIEFNKCADIADTFVKSKSEHHPTIRPEHLPEFFAALRNSHADLIIKSLIEFSLLTIARPSEAANAKWAEIDFEQSLWNIPAERMKMKQPFTIPLSIQAVKILKKLQVITGRSLYIFQSIKKPSQPIGKQIANNTIKQMGYKGKLTSHGLRSIANTYLSEKFIDLNVEIIEACLSHKSQNQVRNAYNRSTYLEQRKPLMNDWGQFVEESMKSSLDL
ncbi:tyrosine-type recombinase/integrase [Glaesserella parasuis]|uniref:tyrosine-type recombinase/integrase n=1 Tax=Glaesserella parasuis TaxID=738 RepID=UPI0021C12BE4|nr:integrase arm-type DNA-binding domain-containing protein [Glaesserella parasuis]MCT8715957.1 tyrosine-type recombinase/integrase [Glaesserella parasuis]MCT8718150.1 tyrosine-type recombinase/integrase [Glaesserella parasuis]MCT8722182.1 tyrosine-type recombinase/integrase [Glaesserella parasuis]MCT8724335.1 tyrosine-type recombinase/integrase [Glaesserella parasuis]MDG6310785.1 tyrosine-type recombinase/integrase [Glaesserella parasuis]